MRYSLACISDTGVVRKHNEDNVAFFGHVMPAEHQTSPAYVAEVLDDEPFVVGIFDGMGGETAGESASYVAATTLKENAGRHEWSIEALLSLLDDMNDAVCDERARLRVSTMGTTATLLALNQDHAFVANVGDSPAMLYAQGDVQTVSHAHTDAEMMRALGIVGRRPGLTQYLGMSEDGVRLSPHACEFTLHPGCAVLLASDGLVESLDEAAIAEVLASEMDTCAKAVRLRDMAIQSGSTDNITVLICEADVPGGALGGVVE